MKPHVILALDTSESVQALAWVDRFLPYTPYYKVGLELFSAAGPTVIEAISKRGGKVFLDLKFHDIPNTVRQACRVATELGVWMTTLHAAGGEAMLAAARHGVEDAHSPGKPFLVAVTVLTSTPRTPALADDVVRLARMAQVACDGVVASGEEAARLRQACGKEFMIVTPGIRLPGQGVGDQARVMDPEAAIAAGATFLVMGRGILCDPSPETVLERVVEWCRKKG